MHFLYELSMRETFFLCCSMVSHVACVPNFRKRIVHKDELSSCDCLRSCAFGLHAVGPVLAKQHEGGARVSAAAGACGKRMDRFPERAGAIQCGRRSPMVGAISRSHSQRSCAAGVRTKSVASRCWLSRVGHAGGVQHHGRWILSTESSGNRRLWPLSV